MNWVNNAFDIFILISQKKLNFWRFERLASVSTGLAKIFSIVSWRTEKLLRFAIVQPWVGLDAADETRRIHFALSNSISVPQFPSFPFSASISPESSVYERTLSAAAASPALYSVTVLLQISVVVFHSYEFAGGEKGRNSIISAFSSSSARWYNLMT